MDGYALKREDRSQKDLHISLIDYENPEANRFQLVNQMEIVGAETRIPDAILYINGLPLVVFEFKSAIRTEATLFNAYEQLTVRYSRDIPELRYHAEGQGDVRLQSTRRGLAVLPAGDRTAPGLGRLS